jgi:hypothetical protein
MADVASLVKRYLNPPQALKRLNYYTVIGLDELIDDRTAIAVAVESAIEKLKSADRKTDPEGFEQIVKVIRQARATLLDDEKKSAYDKQLRVSLRKSAGEKPESSAASSEVIRLQSLLPPGDPSAPFSMSEFLRQPSVESHQETAAERHFALLELARQSAPLAPESSPVNSMPAPVMSNAPPKSVSNVSPRDLQAQIRRNRKKKNMMASAIAIGLSFLFVGGSGLMYWRNLQSDRQQMAAHDASGLTTPQPTIELRDPSLPSTVNPVNNSQPKKRMNLGVVGGNEKSDLGALPKIGASDSTNDEASTKPSKPMVDAKEPKPSADANSKKMVDASEPEAPAPDAAKMEAEAKQWTETMTSARKAIEARDFENFHQLISQALSLSKTDDQVVKRKKLDTFGQLYEQSQDFIKLQISKLKASDVISVGQSSQIAVIEVKANEIILRGKTAKNETYPFDKLPIGFVESLLNLELTDSALHDAVRGTFYLLDPRNSPITKKKSQEFFDKAARADPTLEGLDQVLTEQY